VLKRTADLNLACSGSLEEIREVGDDDEIKEARRALFTSVTMATERGHKAAHERLPSLPLTLKWHYFNSVQRDKFQISNNLLALKFAAMDSFP
jgi:hypothetical protein